MTQFVFNGAYKEYRGYVFANGNPVTIKDDATEKILFTHPEFKVYKSSEVTELEVDAPLQKKRGRPFKGR